MGPTRMRLWQPSRLLLPPWRKRQARRSGYRSPRVSARRSGTRPGRWRGCKRRAADWGSSAWRTPDQPAGVSEDFGWYLDQADGALFLPGCAETDAHPDLHTPEFGLDEGALLIAVDIVHALALVGT